MKLKIFHGILLILAVLVHVYSVIQTLVWGQHISLLVFILLMFLFSYPKLTVRNINFLGFFTASLGAQLTSLYGESWIFNEFSLGFWLASYVFLIMEAIKHTQYNRRNRYLHLYFFVVVAIYTYLFSLHFIEIQQDLSGEFLFSMYVIYYLNLLVLGITALIYYLNSFSKKAVFFIALALSFILSDVLRDMSQFYFRDLSVEIAGAVIKMLGIAFSSLFFMTRERKLRLLNLV